MNSPYLQEDNTPMFEGIEMEYCDILDSVVQITFSYQSFSTVSLVWMVISLVASSDHVPLFPTPFVIEPMHGFIHLINAFTPGGIIP